MKCTEYGYKRNDDAGRVFVTHFIILSRKFSTQRQTTSATASSPFDQQWELPTANLMSTFRNCTQKARDEGVFQRKRHQTERSDDTDDEIKIKPPRIRIMRSLSEKYKDLQVKLNTQKIINSELMKEKKELNKKLNGLYHVFLVLFEEKVEFNL